MGEPQQQDRLLLGKWHQFSPVVQQFNLSGSADSEDEEVSEDEENQEKEEEDAQRQPGERRTNYLDRKSLESEDQATAWRDAISRAKNKRQPGETPILTSTSSIDESWGGWDHIFRGSWGVWGGR